ncbi:hypothetical protein HJ588_17390 [Flexivirga sp. ID2601S]|uniref:PRC-barrel domain containing protein n=1 Tax=Flexivirga aerilata TaxID=1656889 RepID=A0A849AKU6_9MICO|nr:hypothetical protein [Flexivirga aerilata]NNG41035.1 hypothetical protein [Flexivirga aerilata]
MRTLDLLGSDAIDTDGRSLGWVHDLRLESGAAPTQDSGEPAFVIAALVVGPVGFAHRLGFGRGQMAGPWPLTWFFHRLAARSSIVPWSDVVEIEPGRVTIRVERERDEAGGEPA